MSHYGGLVPQVRVLRLDANLGLGLTAEPGAPGLAVFETWEVRSPTPACLSQIETPKDNSCPMAAARIGPGLKHRETRGTRLFVPDSAQECI